MPPALWSCATRELDRPAGHGKGDHRWTPPLPNCGDLPTFAQTTEGVKRAFGLFGV
jgi:hypothetical protein